MRFLLTFLLGLGYNEVNCYSSALTLDLIRICQGDSGLITCPEGLALKIYSAQYGRFVSGSESCPHKSVLYKTEYNCIADVTPYMEMQCDDREKCTVHATNRNLGDPCRGIYKHLDIKYYCDKIPPLTSSPPHITTTYIGQSKLPSKDIMKCTKLYTSVLDSAPHKECDAMQTYKDCLLKVSEQNPASAADIARVMPTLDGNLESCSAHAKQPLVKVCKHSKLKGECMNITKATPDLGDFNDAVKSMKVYAGNWALFSGMGFTGTEDRVKPGFTSHWLGIYAPVQGEPISLYSNDLSSLKPVDDVESGYYFEYTEATAVPTSDFKTDAQSTPDFRVSNSYSEAPKVVTGNVNPQTDPGYSKWVNLDDMAAPKHPDLQNVMCRSTYCLLGIRVIFSQIRSLTLPTRQTVEDIILNRLVDVYQIYPEQLVLAEIVTRSSEVILEIVDMKDAPKRVVDIAIEIEQDIKDEEFTFTIADTIISPDSERYGVMLKTISEEYLPKQIKIVKDDPEEDEATALPSEEPITTPDNVVETHKYWKSAKPTSNAIEPTPDFAENDIEDTVQDVMSGLQAGIIGMPNKYFYPLLATALLLTVVACVIISTVLYRCLLQNREYTLIKKVPSSLSSIYLEVDVPAAKKVEGFENPSYLLEEVDHM